MSRHVLLLALVGIATVAVVVFLSGPGPGVEERRGPGPLGLAFTGLLMAGLLVVQTLILLSVLKMWQRGRRMDQVRTGRAVEVVWALVPTFLALGVVIYSLVALRG